MLSSELVQYSSVLITPAITLIASAQFAPPIPLGCNPHQLMNNQVGFQVQGKPRPDAPTFSALQAAETGGIDRMVSNFK